MSGRGKQRAGNTAMGIAAALMVAAILAAFITAIWAPGRAEEEEPEYITLYVLCKPTSFVNVREFPKKRGTIVGRLECGDEVLTLREKRGKYLKIYGPAFDASEEWVHGGYLTEDQPEIWPEGKAYKVIGKGRVAVRRYVRGKRRVWTQPGKTVTVYAMTAEWALTNRGYIQTEYLEAAEEPETEIKLPDAA